MIFEFAACFLFPFVYELTNKPLEHTPPVISEDSLHNHLGICSEGLLVRSWNLFSVGAWPSMAPNVEKKVVPWHLNGGHLLTGMILQVQPVSVWQSKDPLPT